MPPPLPSQQGSRAGLITTLVIFIVLFLVSTIFWIYARQDVTRLEAEVQKVKKTYADVITTEGLATDPYTTANTKELKAALGANSAFEVVAMQRDDLTKVITGQVTPPADARAFAEGAIQQATDTLPKDPAGAPVVQLNKSQPLTAVIPQLAREYANLFNDRTAVQQALASAQKEKQDAATAHQAAIGERDQQIAARDQEIARVKAEVEGYRQQQTTALTALQEDASRQIKALTDQIALSQQVLGQKDAENKKLSDSKRVLEQILRKFRMDPTENIVRRPDGAITRIPGDGYCFINLGQGDGINVGMTFEVYDKVKGVPALGDGLAEAEVSTRARPAAGATGFDIELPTGKGSIEVVSVGPGKVAQARIIKVQPGQVLNEGDVIANLVYDRNTKHKFFIYGDFDMDGNGVGNAQDTGVIRRLIEQWGGRVAPELSMDVDFVVMGSEPVVPVLTPEQGGDPQAVAAREEAEKRRQAYMDVRARAADFGIPVMNQNRFLAYVGYYDQRRR